MKIKFVIVLFAMAASFGLASAQQTAVMVSSAPGWHKIGSATVDFTKERDEITVLGNDKFTQLKLSAQDASIDLQDLEVYFENGTKQDVQVRTPLNPGMESRVIDLVGGTREIKKVVFVYKTVGTSDTKATLVLYGFKPEAKVADTNHPKTDNADAMDHAGMTGKKGWDKLGETTADLTKDHDVLMVNRYNRLTAIKFFVTDAGIEIMDMKVHFANGETQDVSVRSKIAEGGESRVIDLNGATRGIKSIEFVYKTEPNRGKDKAHIELWGKGSVSDTRSQTGGVKHPVTASTDAGIPKPEVITGDKPGWHKIGENTVSFKKETDAIAVLGNDRFSKLKFKVKDAGIVINDLNVLYEDGTKDDIALKSTFAEGKESRVIDVAGYAKQIKRITFTYHTIKNEEKDKAHVEIWGYKSK